MFGIFKPRTFFNLASTSVFWLKIVLAFALITGLSLALVFSPIDYLQKDTVRIMYVHVPSSWISLFIFLIIGTSSFISLIFKLRVFSVYAKSLAPIGLVFSLISVVTGSLWGYPTWGTFWSWDGRLTSMFILVLTYILYVSLWSFIKNYNSAEKITNIVGIVGLINIPIIKFSVAWWNTLHQPASITLTAAPTIHSSMLAPLLIMFFSFCILSLIIFLIRYKYEIINFRVNKK
ncbi:CcmC ABC-type transport system involved in cytochrome c biogenesis, permease component [Candidatus Pelagibacterales bacterium]|jgi:heme exporter protein C